MAHALKPDYRSLLQKRIKGAERLAYFAAWPHEVGASSTTFTLPTILPHKDRRFFSTWSAALISFGGCEVLPGGFR
jgi:hypothetical protein